MKSVFYSLFFCLLWLAPFYVQSAIIFKDSFETGDYSATNTEGFKWTDKRWTSIVSRTKETADNNGSIIPPRDITNALGFPGGNWTPHSGNYSMRFRYAAGANWSEQRFDLGKPHTEIWISFWLRVPINYAYASGREPAKLFALWMDGYSQHGDGSTVWLSMWRDPNNPSDARVGFTYSLGGHTESTGFRQVVPFITTTDRGRWMQIVLHIKAESSPGKSDGVIQTFRKWGNENKFTKLHDFSAAPIKIPPGGPIGFKDGYILGWVNAPYTENTEWLMDDFSLLNSPPDNFIVSNSPPLAPPEKTKSFSLKCKDSGDSTYHPC